MMATCGACNGTGSISWSDSKGKPRHEVPGLLRHRKCPRPEAAAMSRRMQVAVVLGVFTLGILLVVARDAYAATPVPPVPDPTTTVDAFSVYGFAFIVLALVIGYAAWGIYHAIIGLWKATRFVGRTVEWVRSRPSADAVALQAALDAPVPEALAEFDANLDPEIAARLQRKAAYDEAASVMWTAQRELANDDLIGNVIDLWGRTSKP